MTDQEKTRRQPGWRVLVAATAVTLSGGAAAVAHAADAPSARVTLDDIVPMTEVARPAALQISGSADDVILTKRYDQVQSVTTVATDDGTVAADASPTPNSPDPTPNTPDPTPNSPDPSPNTPDPTPNTPDPSPNTPDPTPETPDLTPESPITPDASPESPD